MADPRDDATAIALARFYDLDLADDPGDLDLYLALAERADGPVLELGAGTGRLAVPLAAAGHRVTAVDIDPSMLARASRRAASVDGVGERLRLQEADIVGLRLADAGSYGLAFIALNSILLLGSRDGQRAAMRALADHLGPGGLAVVDVWLPDAEDLARFDGRTFLEYQRVDPDTGDVVVKVGSAVHDATTGIVSLTTIYEAGPQGGSPARWVRHDRLRLIGADELVAHAEDVGLRVEVVAGGYDLDPIGPGADRAVLVAVRP